MMLETLGEEKAGKTIEDAVRYICANKLKSWPQARWVIRLHRSATLWLKKWLSNLKTIFKGAGITRPFLCAGIWYNFNR